MAAKGEQYWREERRICAVLLCRASAAGASGSSPPQLTIDELHAASEAKSFDYRVHASPKETLYVMGCHLLALPCPCSRTRPQL